MEIRIPADKHVTWECGMTKHSLSVFWSSLITFAFDFVWSYSWGLKFVKLELTVKLKRTNLALDHRSSQGLKVKYSKDFELHAIEMAF